MVGIWKANRGLEFSGKVAKNSTQALWYLYKEWTKENPMYWAKWGKLFPRKSLGQWYRDNVIKSKYSTEIEVYYCYRIKEVEEI